MSTLLSSAEAAAIYEALRTHKDVGADRNGNVVVGLDHVYNVYRFQGPSTDNKLSVPGSATPGFTVHFYDCGSTGTTTLYAIPSALVIVERHHIPHPTLRSVTLEVHFLGRSTDPATGDPELVFQDAGSARIALLPVSPSFVNTISI